MTNRHPIDEIDLLALADGFLDDDPVRKAEIEAALLANPLQAERLADYRAQTSALRAAYAGVLAERVPDRLSKIVSRPSAARHSAGIRLVAASVMLVAGGLAGWLVGNERGDPVQRALLESSYQQFLLHDAEQSARPAAAGPGSLGRDTRWINDEVAIRLSAPDLTSEGFTLVEKRAIRQSEDQLVALEYLSEDGRSFSLFITPRWTDQPGPIVDQERGGVSMAYWHDGPLAASIATELPRVEARAIADAVRRAMQDDTTSPPGIAPEFRPVQNPQEGLMADSLNVTPQSRSANPVTGEAPVAVEAN